MKKILIITSFSALLISLNSSDIKAATEEAKAVLDACITKPDKLIDIIDSADSSLQLYINLNNSGYMDISKIAIGMNNDRLRYTSGAENAQDVIQKCMKKLSTIKKGLSHIIKQYQASPKYKPLSPKLVEELEKYGIPYKQY